MHTAKCGNPIQQDGVNSWLRVTDNSEPAVEGSNITFDCLSESGQFLSGLHKSTCMTNGMWIPDLANAVCERSSLIVVVTHSL